MTTKRAGPLRFRRALFLVARHRRWVVAGLLATAVVAGLTALTPALPSTVPVVVAAHDLAAGTVLAAGDLAVIRLAPETAPAGTSAATDLLPGRSVAAAMRRGEPFTDARLVGPGLLVGATGLVAAPVRLADAAAAALARPGDVVDVLAAVDTTGLPGAPVEPAQPVASGVRVLAVPPEPAGAAGEGALVVLAVTPATALALAGAAASSRLSITIMG